MRLLRACRPTRTRRAAHRRARPPSTASCITHQVVQRLPSARARGSRQRSGKRRACLANDARITPRESGDMAAGGRVARALRRSPDPERLQKRSRCHGSYISVARRFTPRRQVRRSHLRIPCGIPANSHRNHACGENHPRPERLALVLHRSALLILFFQPAGAVRSSSGRLVRVVVSKKKKVMPEHVVNEGGVVYG
jgi:hypothetical protein